MSSHAEYQRRRREADPEYAQRSREQSLAAKRRRRGVCEVCGGETRYNGVTTKGASHICADCHRQRIHDARRWTKDTIARAFRRFYAEFERPPTAADAMGPCESLVLGLSGARIRELEQVKERGVVLPAPEMVRREFGSWAEAVRASGMQPSRGGSADHRRKAWRARHGDSDRT